MRRLLVPFAVVPLAAALLVGCRATEPPKDADVLDTAGHLDPDGDGYTVEEGDCDDGDANVSPGSTELCNGIDDNCDGVVDEGVEGTFYADEDRDGFGDPTNASVSCTAPSGYVTSGTDCDDTSAEAWPGNAELCDDVDNDCDGVVDDGVTRTFYADADLDGHGDPAAALTSCTPPVGSVLDGDDCDDSSAEAYPGNPEVCDERDNDCNGVVDEGVTFTWYGDIDGDGYGDTTLVQEACDQPAGYVGTADDCDDAVPSVNPGATELCNGDDDDCDGTVDEADATDASTWYADADADGWGATGSATRACAAPAGYVPDGTDCDDGRAATHPTATEYCNTYDDDCDGTIDEADAADAVTWHLDYDGDGWGGARFSSVACSAPAGYVASDSDCDDAAAGSHPEGTEVCDDTDNDCDGLVDDGLSTPTWYADEDGDGWGDADFSVTECAAPTGFVADDGDCDDTDPSMSPSETEVCDGFDEDCSGNADDGGVCPCDVDWYADHPYMFCETASTWTAAQTTCATYGYHLATVSGVAEDDWLVSVATTTYTGTALAYWWLGLNDRASEGGWVWEDGSPVTYTRWNSGEPNNSGDEDCTQLIWGTHWNDWPCGLASTYICEAD
ncbi:MAG: MopE-related protein [Pseudomonadota bacterium]|nr:MopE-related protein [Pseudomonadota bacterium]